MLADPRFTAVTSIKERRSLFDVFCRSAADRHKKPKIDRTPAARDAFMALLNEAQALAQDGEAWAYQSTLLKVACVFTLIGRKPLQASWLQRRSCLAA